MALELRATCGVASFSRGAFSTAAFDEGAWDFSSLVIFKKKGGGGSRAVEVKGYAVTAKQLAQIQREDEELVTIITMIGEHLL